MFGEFSSAQRAESPGAVGEEVEVAGRDDYYGASTAGPTAAFEVDQAHHRNHNGELFVYEPLTLILQHSALDIH